METRANLVTVGLFVLAVIAAGFGSAFWLLKGGEGSRRAGLVVVFPGSVSGLVTGANVSFNGIKVGEVKKLSFAPDDPSRVIARVDVDAETPIKTDSHASLGYQGLTGVATVQIWGGSAQADGLLDRDENERLIYAERSSMQDILEGAQRVLTRLDGAVATVDQLIKDNADSVKRTVKNAETFSDALSKNADGVEKFMSAVSKAGDVLASVSGKIETLADDVDGLVRTVDRGKVTAIVDDAHSMMGRLDEASKRVDGILAKIDGIAGSEEGKGVVKQAATFLEEATAAAKSIKETSQAFQARAAEIADGMAKLTGAGVRDLRDFVAEGRRTLGTIDRAVGNIDRDPKRLIFGGQGGAVPEYSGNRR
ncbi:MAG: MlaD family protein [Siculibacillus sp.]|nr:MlaD family protein [Siculibacillus sp.]